ncbi:MAG: signal recognition particle-docking protein FtsY [Desulfurococcales archaeon]|nr:signal recognition particle-docking protein FtsY [Desulfurococcales archaeon]
MFDKFKQAVSAITSSLKDKITYREIKESDVNDALEDFLLRLLEADVAYDVANDIVNSVRDKLVGLKVKRGIDVEEVVKDAVRRKLLDIFGYDGYKFNLIDRIRKVCNEDKRPFVIVFLGVNGVGKTTTIAKMAYIIDKLGLKPVLAASDTFRAGAQEQLELHAKRVNVPIIKGAYGRDPASVAVDAINYAKANGYCVVLIDTAGRMHVDYDLMGELKKIVRVSNPDLKILVVDSLTGNDAVEQAERFDREIGVDAIILTKVDADVKGGTAISVAAAIKKPIIYIGVGQRYEDLREFNAKEIIDAMLK